jgi:CubicO group peptidase (beta-lactamase class C family)
MASASNVSIDGVCDPRFNRVRDVFVENFESRGELGAAVAVTVDNHPVVDLWGGFVDPARSAAWTRDTIVNVYSTTKGLTAIAAHRLVDQGRLDLDAPVAKYWPEFAQAGKDRLPVRMLLNHQAGLPAVRAPLPDDAPFVWDKMTAALAAQEPWWTPGTRHGYHAFTYGWLVGEVIRRITELTPGTYFRQEVAEPLGLDCHIGLDSRHDSRVAPLQAPAPPKPGEINPMAALIADPESISAKAIANPPSLIPPVSVNTRRWRGAEIPAANGHTNARALARLYGALASGGSADGYRLLTPAAITRCHTQESLGLDAVMGQSSRFSTGFMLSQPGPETSLGPNPHSFGHPGAGGSIGYADPTTRIGFGYAMNQMGAGVIIDPRATALINAVYQSLI